MAKKKKTAKKKKAAKKKAAPKKAAAAEETKLVAAVARAAAKAAKPTPDAVKQAMLAAIDTATLDGRQLEIMELRNIVVDGYSTASHRNLATRYVREWLALAARGKGPFELTYNLRVVRR
jgi:hypothetical protein